MRTTFFRSSHFCLFDLLLRSYASHSTLQDILFSLTLFLIVKLNVSRGILYFFPQNDNTHHLILFSSHPRSVHVVGSYYVSSGPAFLRSQSGIQSLLPAGWSQPPIPEAAASQKVKNINWFGECQHENEVTTFNSWKPT